MYFTPPDSLHPVTDETPDLFQAATLAMRDEVRVLTRRWALAMTTSVVLSVAVLVLGGVVWSLKHAVHVFPYVVEVAETGQVRTVGVLPQTWERASPAVIDRVVRVWLYQMRRVGIDPVMMQEQYKDADLFMTAPAIRLAYPFKKDRTELLESGKTTMIAIRTLLPMTPDFRTVEIEWDEQTFTKQRTLEKVEPWKAIVSLTVVQKQEIDPKKVGDLRNPLGIFISDFAWQVVAKGKD